VTLAYSDFLASKRWTAPASDIICRAEDVSDALFDFQRAIVAWAVSRGRAAVWADTGLGKSRIQVEWLRIVLASGGHGLILAPLGVTAQTVAEAAAIGVDVTYVHDQGEADTALERGRIVVTNYDRLHKLDPSAYTAVVLDESSILKAYSGETKRALVAAFRSTRYRLCCTATPAPNDLEELCNHADFLGVMRPAEMRSTFFIADSRGEFMRYRLKGHAKGAFYDWLASWAIACRNPADLGFDGSAYRLPPLRIIDHVIPSGWTADGELFTPAVKGVTEQARLRAGTLQARVARAVELVRAEPDEAWLVWCGMNAEADAVTAAIPGAINVQGSDRAEVKQARLADFAAGRIRVLVTKCEIAGYGLNFQAAARMVFVGLGYSYEKYYQAIRRCYRFGQTRKVIVHVVLADLEQVVAHTVRAKEAQHRSTTAGLVAAIAEQNRRELFAGTSKSDDYEPSRPLTLPRWLRTAA
jgi:hypothetical protein